MTNNRWPAGPHIEPEHQIDALLKHLHRQRDKDLNVWAIEALADGVGRAVVVGAEDPIDDADAFFQQGLTACFLAGQEPENLGRLKRLIGQVLRDLGEQLQLWEEEGKGVGNRPDCTEHTSRTTRSPSVSTSRQPPQPS